MASALFQMLVDCAEDERRLEALKHDPAKFMAAYDLSDDQKALVVSALTGKQHDLLKAIGDEVYQKTYFC